MSISCIFGILALLVGADADSTKGPPQSPFSWTRIREAGKPQQFTPDEKILGVAKQPSSISLVDFHDERPYGVAADSRAWLVRYDDVGIPMPEGGTLAVYPLFLVFSQSSGELIAAFTQSAPIWSKQGWSSEDITKRAAYQWELFPPDSSTLRSSVLDVLWTLRTREGARLWNAGQITIRPRQFLSRATFRDDKGNVVPQTKTNGWLVEVLGTLNGYAHGWPTNTYVVVFHDGYLSFAGSIQL